MECCHACGRPFTEPTNDAPEGVANALVSLRAECAVRGIWRSHDDRVRIEGAAELLGLKPKTLRNWRASEDPRLPPFEVRGGRPLFALSGLAAHLEGRK